MTSRGWGGDCITQHHLGFEPGQQWGVTCTDLFFFRRIGGGYANPHGQRAARMLYVHQVTWARCATLRLQESTRAHARRVSTPGLRGLIVPEIILQRAAYSRVHGDRCLIPPLPQKVQRIVCTTRRACLPIDHSFGFLFLIHDCINFPCLGLGILPGPYQKL